MLRVLDVGCGSGASLLEELIQSEDGGARSGTLQLVGVDLDWAALRKGKTLHPEIDFVCARGERLPFADCCFEVVNSRVALPYMEVHQALHEFRRVLEANGQVKLKLHPLSFTLSELSRELRSGSIRNRLANFVYRSYVLANGAALHMIGRTFRFPLARWRCESFQTRTGMERRLKAVGFRSINASCWSTKIDPPHAGNCRVSAVR